MPTTRKNRIDVFISSTSLDLPEYRAAVRDAILSLGLFPSGMENWPVAGENPVDLCKNMLDSAEIYLGIYAHRYGWRPDGHGGKSITELEYDWAGEETPNRKPIPRLCFIMKDDYPWPTDQIEFAAQDDLKRFKAKVKQHQIGFFTTPDNLRAQVAEALAGFVQRSNLRILTPYLRWLHDQSKRSGLLHVLKPRDASGKDESVSVDQVYTPLDTQQIVERDSTGQLYALLSPLDREDLQRENLEKSPLALMEAVDIYPRIVLLGDPGSGKSTFLG